MTQKEAIIRVIEELGGRANLAEIYPRVINMAKFKPGSDMEATIRATLLRHPKQFRQSIGRKGYWELTTFQEEIASLRREISNLKALLKEKDETISVIKNVKTEDDFVRRLLSVTKCLYKRDEDELDVVRKLFYTVGRRDAEEELDAWIEGREKKSSISVNGDIVLNKETNIDKNYAPNIEHNGGTLSLPGNGQ